MKKRLTRRQFLLTLLSAGAAGYSWLKLGSLRGAEGAGGGTSVFLPQIMRGENTPVPTPSPTPPPLTDNHRVVRVHHNSVTNWSGSPEQYWNYVSQDYCRQMVNNGVCALTGATTTAGAWHALLPNYQSGQIVAIKQNFNNTMQTDACSTPSPQVNPLHQILIPVIEGLVSIGVNPANIYVYDRNRSIPDYFYNPVHSAFPGVVFFDQCHSAVENSTASITFSPKDGASFTRKITKAAEDATYLINIPIMKNHSGAGISLGFKNHFGTVEDPGDLHSRTFIPEFGGTQFDTDYNPLVDLYKSPLIGSKTVLTIGDGIFGTLGRQDIAPAKWLNTFGDYPKSLFFAVDPVAIDCVMADFLNAENEPSPAGSQCYLDLAAAANLGVCEHVSNPLANPAYTQIDYQLVNLG